MRLFIILAGILILTVSCTHTSDSQSGRTAAYKPENLQKTKRILLFDKLDGESKNEVNNEPGIISSDTKFIQTGYDTYNKGFLTGTGKGERCITYKGEGNFNPLQGTLEMWVKVGADFGKTTKHEDLAVLKVDNNNCIGLYYNGKARQLIYWIKDSDTLGQNIHKKELNSFMAYKVNWLPGEYHHIAITWEKDHEILYLDGKAVRWQSFRGQLYAEFNENSKIQIARDSNFIIDTVRIWNYARAPRKIDKELSLTDEKEVFKFNTHPAADNDKYSNTITAGRCELSVSPETGLPSTLIDRDKDVKLLWDESKLFFNNKQLKLHGSLDKKNTNISGSFKATNEPAIDLTTKYSKDSDSIKLELTLKNKTDKIWQKDVTIVFNSLTEDSMGFMALAGGAFEVKNGIESYCHTKQGNQLTGAAHPTAYIPSAVVYQPKKDYGFTVTQAMNVPEYVTIDFGHDFPTDQLAMINRDVTIKPNESRTLLYYFSVHPGDWRSGLNFVQDKFPATFKPGAEKYSKMDGGMVLGVRTYPQFLEDTKGCVYREISMQNRDQLKFGEYVPDNPNETSLKFYQKISGIVKTLNKNDILGLLYIQARECKDIELAKERFKASIQYDTNGNILTSYGFGAKMLCPKNSNWHNHLVLQAEKMLKHIPNADGFFFDNSWDKEYSDIINAIGELAHSKGLYFATNGASANCSAATDSIMAEGDTHTLKGLSYLALSQPIIFLPINHYNAYGYKGVVNEFGHKGRAMGLIDNFQNDLKECLINGAYYSYDWPGTDGYDKESKRIYKDYLPLENNLKGKKWYLIPHALKVPVNVKANIFENGKGELITYITSEGFPFCGKALAPFKVSIRVPGRLIKSALIRRIEDKKEIAIPFKQVTDTIEIEVSNHCSITMLKLK